jgi:hypothetical protein
VPLPPAVMTAFLREQILGGEIFFFPRQGNSAPAFLREQVLGVILLLLLFLQGNSAGADFGCFGVGEQEFQIMKDLQNGGMVLGLGHSFLSPGLGRRTDCQIPNVALDIVVGKFGSDFRFELEPN